MTDSLFTNQNHHDAQIQQFDMVGCALLMEAVARRVSVLKGPLYTSGRFQRIADICAGVYVLPIDQWRRGSSENSEEPTSTVKPSRFDRVWAVIVENPGFVLSVGFVLGVWVGGGG